MTTLGIATAPIRAVPATGGKGFGKHHLPSCFQLSPKWEEGGCGHVNVQVSEMHQVTQGTWTPLTQTLREPSAPLSLHPLAGKREETAQIRPLRCQQGPLVISVAQTVQQLLAKPVWPRLLSLPVICSKRSGEQNEERDRYLQSCIYIPAVNGLREIFIQEIT